MDEAEKDWSVYGMGSVATQMVSHIESVRSTIEDVRPTFVGDAEWDYHVRASMNALRLAQVHFHQLAGISSEPVLVGRSSWCFDNKCDMNNLLSIIGAQMFVFILFFGVLIILMVYHVLDSRHEDQPWFPNDRRDAPPTYRQATGRDAELAPECAEQLMTEERGGGEIPARHARLLRRLATRHLQGPEEQPAEEGIEERGQLPVEEIIERNTAVLERLTDQIDDVEERLIRRNHEKLEKAYTENKRLKTELMLARNRAEELQRKYYKVSLIPRMLGAKGENIHERLRNALFHNFTFPEVRKHVIEEQLGIPTPPGWVLTEKAADEFISAHFPGTGTKLSWNRRLPGVNFDGSIAFQRLIHQRSKGEPDQLRGNYHDEDEQDDGGAPGGEHGGAGGPHDVEPGRELRSLSDTQSAAPTTPGKTDGALIGAEGQGHALPRD